MAGVFLHYRNLPNVTSVITQVLAIATMLLLGDVISQTLIQRKRAIDARQAARFFVIGAVYTGPLVVTWYGLVEAVIGQDGLVAVVAKVLLGQMVFLPLLLLGFIVLFDVTQGRPWTDIKESVRTKFVPMLMASYIFWLPVEFVNFRFVAVWCRPVYNGVACLCFKTYMAWRMSRVHPMTDTTPTAKELAQPA
ncbi:unnamed protein product [Ixodes hexagonus]